MNINLENLKKLTPQETQQLINGISPEAAAILKKIIPDSPLIDMLVQIKAGFSNF